MKPSTIKRGDIAYWMFCAACLAGFFWIAFYSYQHRARPLASNAEWNALYEDSICGGGIITQMSDEDSTNTPTHRATEVIKDLKAGRVPQTVVRDLGEAVGQATRDHGVGRALGNSRVSGGMGR